MGILPVDQLKRVLEKRKLCLHALLEYIYNFGESLVLKEQNLCINRVYYLPGFLFYVNVLKESRSKLSQHYYHCLSSVIELGISRKAGLCA